MGRVINGKGPTALRPGPGELANLRLALATARAIGSQ